MGAKQEKFKLLANFSHFWPFEAPLFGPQGSYSRDPFSSIFSALDQCNDNESFLPERNRWWQNPKTQFWSIFAIFGPLEPPWGP